MLLISIFQVSFEEKKEELFEMVWCLVYIRDIVVSSWQYWLILILIFELLQVSIPAWFTVDTRLGSLSIHLDTPQCFSAEMYSADLNIAGKPEDDKVYSFKFTGTFLLLFLSFWGTGEGDMLYALAFYIEVPHVGYYLFFVDLSTCTKRWYITGWNIWLINTIFWMTCFYACY